MLCLFTLINNQEFFERLFVQNFYETDTGEPLTFDTFLFQHIEQEKYANEIIIISYSSFLNSQIFVYSYNFGLTEAANSYTYNKVAHLNNPIPIAHY